MTAACSYAGASLKKDAVDSRITQDVKSGSGRIIKDIDDVRNAHGTAWPSYSASTTEISAQATDTDGDGMPDWFEEKFDLNKNSAADGKTMTLDKKGRYTNLEMYLHYLVRDITEAQVAGGTYKAL